MSAGFVADVVAVCVKLTLPGSITANSIRPRAASASIWAKRTAASANEGLAPAVVVGIGG